MYILHDEKTLHTHTHTRQWQFLRMQSFAEIRWPGFFLACTLRALVACTTEVDARRKVDSILCSSSEDVDFGVFLVLAFIYRQVKNHMSIHVC